MGNRQVLKELKDGADPWKPSFRKWETLGSFIQQRELDICFTTSEAWQPRDGRESISLRVRSTRGSSQ